MATHKTIQIEQINSVIGSNERQRATVRGLGLRRIRHVVEVEDTPATRGMISKVSHLVRVVEN
jgi:large subunit ribosomal protein L30